MVETLFRDGTVIVSVIKLDSVTNREGSEFHSTENVRVLKAVAV